MDLLEPARLTAAILVVAGLIALLGWAIRRFELSSRMGGGAGRGRLTVVETRWIDQRHRLLLIRRDDTEHLLLLTPTAPLLVERIASQQPGLS